jgi:hypothetical protein
MTQSPESYSVPALLRAIEWFAQIAKWEKTPYC